MLEQVVTLVSLGVASGTAAFTIAKTKITAPMRLWVNKHNKWLGQLFSCPYCLSHWLAAIAVLIYQPELTHENIVLDFGVSWLLVVFIASVTWGTIMRQMKTMT